MRKARVRVALLDEHAVLYDLNTGARSRHSKLPEWMNESIAMLNMVEARVEVPDIGVRVEVYRSLNGPPTYYLTIRGELPNED